MMTDGRAGIAIENATPGDALAIEQFMLTLSPESRRTRFFSAMTDAGIITETARELAQPTVVASVVAREGGRVIGHAIAFRLEDAACDVSLAVADRFQHHGVGALMLECLMREAAAAGMRRFEAEILAENRNMLHIFRRAGYRFVREPDVGVVRAAASLE